MKINITFIEQSGQYGMPVPYIRGFLLAAQQQNLVIGVRKVSHFSKDLISSSFPTKPFIVKNKTANTGVVAGYISISPIYSRSLANEYGEYEAALERAFLSDSSLKPTELFLSAERIQALQLLFKSDMMVTDIHDMLSEYKRITWMNNGVLLCAYAIKQDALFQILDENQMPILILGKAFLNESGASVVQPMTSDFDLLVVCPSYDEFDPAGLDKTPIDAQQAASGRREIGPDLPSEDPRGGNWSPRITSAIECINQTIAKIVPLRQLPELKTVHHNAEFTNPFAHDIEGCLPSLLVFPKPMNLGGLPFVDEAPPGDLTAVDVILIESVNEMAWIHDFLRDEGYYWPSHAQYTRLSPFRRDAMKAAEQSIASIARQAGHPILTSSPSFFCSPSTQSNEVTAGVSMPQSCGCV